MTDSKPHRKRVKHYDNVSEPHELTFSCYRRLPLLTDPSRLHQLSRSFDKAAHRLGWAVAAFVFMPEHVHALVYPTRPGSKISQLLFAVKRPFAYRVKQELIARNDPLRHELTIQQRPGVQTFRFWQEGPGYDRNLRSEKTVLAAIDYIHLNPVRRGLVERAVDWEWSSARWYASDGTTVDDSLPKLTALPATYFVGRSDATP